MSPEMQLAIDHAFLTLTTYSLRVMGALVILVVGWLCARFISRHMEKMMVRTSRMDATLAHFIANLVYYSILTFTVLAMLAKFGIETASIIAAIAGASLAIGLALQGTLKHIASGVMLLLFRPFKLGDKVDITGLSGTVYTIGLFTTELNGDDGVRIIIPNGQIWEKAIKNFSVNPAPNQPDDANN